MGVKTYQELDMGEKKTLSLLNVHMHVINIQWTQKFILS